MVDLLFQTTGGRFVNLDEFLPGFAHLFINSLNTQEQEGKEEVVRDGEREEEREGGINMGDASYFQDSRSQKQNDDRWTLKRGC